MKFTVTCITEKTFFDIDDLSIEDILYLFDGLNKEDKWIILPKGTEEIGVEQTGTAFHAKDIERLAIRIKRKSL